jgi:hypothetical protein
MQVSSTSEPPRLKRLGVVHKSLEVDNLWEVNHGGYLTKTNVASRRMGSLNR